MAELPRIDSEGLRLAAQEGHKRVSSVVRASRLDPIQNNCKYGYVLPDRCRYTRHLGCDCGAYPPIEQPLPRTDEAC